MSIYILQFFVLLFCLFPFKLNAENYPYRSDVLWVTVPDNNNWLYNVGEDAKVDIQVFHYGIAIDNIELYYEIGDDMMEADTHGSVLLKKGCATINLGSKKSPGFRDCRMTINLNGELYKHHVKVGFSPELLKPYTKLPNDFAEFWKKNIEYASKCPMKYTKKYVPEFSTDNVDYYLIRLQSYVPGNYIYGYLSQPKKEGKYPVVLCPPGAGVKTIKEPQKHIFYAENNCIRLEIDIHGLNPEIPAENFSEISSAFGDYLTFGIDSKDTYYMKKVYMGCIRAIDFLTTLPNWDGKNVIVQGGSQGGALALITAGLDNRVTACVANHPALSDMSGYKMNRAGGYPHFFKKYVEIDTPNKINTLFYYDVVNFARFIKVPVFMTWGFNDDVCPPTTSYIVYNILKCQKEALITPINEHWVSDKTEHKQLNWILEHLIK